MSYLLFLSLVKIFLFAHYNHGKATYTCRTFFFERLFENLTHHNTTTLLNFVVILSVMTQTTRLENSAYNILIALGREADFLYSTVDTYIEDAKKDNREYLVEIWNQMKRDKEKHLQMLREALEKEAKDEKLSK